MTNQLSSIPEAYPYDVSHRVYDQLCVRVLVPQPIVPSIVPQPVLVPILPQPTIMVVAPLASAVIPPQLVVSPTVNTNPPGPSSSKPAAPYKR